MKSRKRKQKLNTERDRNRTGTKANKNLYKKLALELTTEYDAGIIFLIVLLTVFGIIMVYDASYYQTAIAGGSPFFGLIKQCIYAGGSIVMMLAVAHYDYHKYTEKKAMIMAIISIVALVALIPYGKIFDAASGGAVRWFYIGPLSVQPSEFSKFFMIVFTSVYVAKNPTRAKTLNGILVIAGVMLIHAALIVTQPNLSTAIVICAIMAGILFVGGLPFGYVFLAFGFLAVGVEVIMKFFPHSHWYSRIMTFMNPFADAQGEGYQVAQSLIALGNGGFKGLGLGNSISKNLYLPEPQNDFILAVIGEELGFIGIMVLMCIYLYLIYRCTLVASRAKDKLGMFLASGVTIMLALQVLINVAVATASMPATGITLPFISAGGSSLVVFGATMGILLNVSKKRE